jgi:hypothetical protein
MVDNDLLRIVFSFNFACRKRWLNGVPLRLQNQVPLSKQVGHDNDLSQLKHRTKFCCPLRVMIDIFMQSKNSGAAHGTRTK